MVKTISNRLSVLFLMLLGTMPQIALLTESLELFTDSRLWYWILAAALCLWISACFRRGILLGMPASAALLYAAYRYYDSSPLTELDDLMDKFSGALYTHYYADGGSYTYLNAVEDHSFLLLLIAFLLLAYLSSALSSRSGRPFMSLLGTIPLFAACLAVNGVPSYGPVVCMLLFWILVLAGGNYREEGGGGKTLFLLSMPVLLFLSGILWFSHPEDYSISERDIALSQQFDRLGEMLHHWLEENTAEEIPLPGTVWTTPESLVSEGDALLWESVEGGLDLTQKCSLEMLEKVFYRVQAQSEGSLYLRAVSYGDYLGTGWDSAGSAPLSSLAFTAQALKQGGDRQSLSIRTEAALRYTVVPYYTDLSRESDAFLLADQQPERIRYYHPSGALEGLGGTEDKEAVYRSYAHEIYTRLPEETRNAMLSLAQQAGLDAASPAIVDEVAAYIRESAVYDIDTEPYPSSDYAVWFLTQAHRGYCVHFATAATAMYRALGIPARITEGFLVQADRSHYVEVKGENAHAWVEIYRDGLGWIPVEVTGQSGLTRPEEPEPAEQDTDPNEGAEEPKTSASPQAEPETLKPSAAPLPVGIVRQETESVSSPATASGGFRKVLQVALPILLLLAAVPVWRLAVRGYWRRRISSLDRNRAAAALYRRSKCLSRFGVSVPLEIQNCAEKAYFSAQGVNAEEVQLCQEIFLRTVEETYSRLTPMKRFLFLFVYALK